MNSEQNLTREEAIAILNTPDEQLNELIERAGTLRKKYKGNHVSIHLLTNARSGNCSQNCAYCAQHLCASHSMTNGLQEPLTGQLSSHLPE